MIVGRDLPWLQDTNGGPVTTSWGANYRDFVILDPANERPVAAYNLTTNSLSDPANRAQLKAILLGLAELHDADGDRLSDYWEDEMFDGNYSAGPSDNNDGDNANNLLEYALGSRADNPASQPRTTIGTLTIGDDQFQTITFRRRLGASGGLTYLVEFSETLETWASGPAEVVETSRVNPYDGTGTEIVTYRSVQPLSALAGHGFLRVRCGLP